MTTRSESGRTLRLRPGCSPRSTKNEPRRRRISGKRRRTSHSPPGEWPPSDGSRPPGQSDKLWISDAGRWTAGPRRCLLCIRRSIAFPPCSIVDPQNPGPARRDFLQGNRNSGSIRHGCTFSCGCCRHMRLRSSRPRSARPRRSCSSWPRRQRPRSIRTAGRGCRSAPPTD